MIIELPIWAIPALLAVGGLLGFISGLFAARRPDPIITEAIETGIREERRRAVRRVQEWASQTEAELQMLQDGTFLKESQRQAANLAWRIADDLANGKKPKSLKQIDIDPLPDWLPTDPK